MNLLCKQICQCCRILWFCVHNKQSNFTEAYGYPSMSSTGKTMCTFKVFGKFLYKKLLVGIYTCTVGSMGR